MRRRAIEVSVSREHYILSASAAERSIVDSCKNPVVIERVKGTDKNTVVICDPEYIHSLLAYYNWGQSHPSNYLEDISDISCQVFKEGDITVIIPRFVIRQITEKRSKTMVVQTVEDLEESLMLNAMFNREVANSDYAWLCDFGPLLVAGHCHSHPNLGGIGVHPSSTDVNEHNSHLVDDENRPWISQIVDPVRCLSAFYCGKSMKTPDVVYIMYEDDAKRFHGGYNPIRKAPRKCYVQHIKEVIDTDSVGICSEDDCLSSDDICEVSSVLFDEETVKTSVNETKKHRLSRKKASKIKLKRALKDHSSVEEINKIIEFINSI